MGNLKINLTWKLRVLMMFLLVGNVDCAVNLVKNGDFSSHTSITQINDWMILNNPNQIQQSTRDDWVLEPNSQGSGYFLSLFNQFAVQTISSVPAGVYKLSADIRYRQGSQPFYADIAAFYNGFWIYIQQSYYSSAEVGEISITFTLSQQQNVKISIATYNNKKLKFTNVKLENIGSLSPITGTPGTTPSTGTPGTTPSTGTPGTTPSTGTPGTTPSTTPPPITTINNIANCKTQKTISGSNICISCFEGYVLSQGRTCSSKVDFCFEYRGNKCSQCIDGYLFSNGGCVQKPTYCQKTGSNGRCIQCVQGFYFIQESCIKIPLEIFQNVFSTQYLPGDVENCIQYALLSSQCVKCKDGYQLNSENICVRTCPSNTDTVKYILINDKCISTDINCAQANSDGTCRVCQNNFYLSNSKCLLLAKISADKSQDGRRTSQILVDSQGRSYLIQQDGSRIYLTGPWKNLQVWSDNSNNLYLKTANEGRKYLTGPYANLTAFKDLEGKWYVVTSEGERRKINEN